MGVPTSPIFVIDGLDVMAVHVEDLGRIEPFLGHDAHVFVLDALARPVTLRTNSSRTQTIACEVDDRAAEEALLRRKLTAALEARGLIAPDVPDMAAFSAAVAAHLR